MNPTKLSLYGVHCGFYDAEIGDGIYESHVNVFVVAENQAEARLKAKALDVFRRKRMHIDGLQEIVAVGGYRIRADAEASLEGQTRIIAHKHRELAPVPAGAET